VVFSNTGGKTPVFPAMIEVESGIVAPAIMPDPLIVRVDVGCSWMSWGIVERTRLSLRHRGLALGFLRMRLRNPRGRSRSGSASRNLTTTHGPALFGGVGLRSVLFVLLGRERESTKCNRHQCNIFHMPDV
jgi:hypothetical protein